ncbi:MAG: SDR family NAD(P)-dependent oxidoreductase [Chloroflexi bacterium]|jgi:3-oxoacyl-[acyl-carrier protein] reductase|nr:SDR family NAD(P)-dependent oxidoreductase [Chloroflexota bacterium]MBT7081416.1 SDR family NAD(P)-dependent oxidoreductase [Chloroflexota bacterium]MBT7290464.1 SDR family NAD(P)-dependent oxidoreductase [Chloroflexota bacterium]
MGDALKDRVAVVTGSGQGMGKAIAMGIAAQGAKVITNNRKAGTEGGDAQTVVDEIVKAGGQATAVFGDAAKWDDAKNLIDTAVNTYGRIDILVNNAGADFPRMMWNMTEEDWDRCVGAVLKTAFNCSRFASAYMREQRYGRIINNTSSAWLGTVGHVNYGAAKAGVVGLTRATAREVGKYGVTCNCFAATAKTRMTVNPGVEAGMKKRYEQGLITKERLDEMLNPPEIDTVAPLVIYLASEKAADINGHIFDILGGKLALYSEPEQIKSIIKDDGIWTQDELWAKIPKTLGDNLDNPAPAEPAK